MATATFYADRIQIIDSYNPNTSGTAESIGSMNTGEVDGRDALVHFPFPSNLYYRKISSIQIYYYTTPWTSGIYSNNPQGTIWFLTGSFDSGVTYNTAPSHYGTADYIGKSTANYSYINVSVNRLYALEFGVRFNPTSLGLLSTSLNTNPPYAVVTYSDTDDFGSVTGNPSSGYVDKNKPNTFRWSYSPPEDIVADPPTVVSSRFAYRKTSSGNFTFVSTGSSQEYTAAAGMFSDVDTFYWYPEVTLSNGETLVPVSVGTGQNVIYTMSTVEPTFTSVARTPSGTIEDGDASITFTWLASNSVGSSPSGAELAYSPDNGSTWTTFGTITGSAKTYTAPGNTFPGGEIRWRVRSLNNAGTAGSWSAYLTFICVAAPTAPSVSCDAAPFTTIEWEASGQEAYELTVDGVSYGIHFGTEKSFTLPLPLDDGNHQATVKVQGSYGLWSEAGSVLFTVENVPAGTLDLTAQFGVDADLLWAYSANGDDFLVFRDSVQIGHTAQNSFSDRRSLGAHAWFVLLRQADGNYTKSNTVTGTLSTEYPAIALLAGGPWLSLRLSENSIPLRQFVYSKTYTLRHFSGSPFPVLELTPYKDLSGTFRCAFSSQAEAQAFEALFGNVVIMKSNESVIIGGMVNLEKVRSTFYAAYQFTLQQIAVEEIVDDSDS